MPHRPVYLFQYLGLLSGICPHQVLAENAEYGVVARNWPVAEDDSWDEALGQVGEKTRSGCELRAEA